MVVGETVAWYTGEAALVDEDLEEAKLKLEVLKDDGKGTYSMLIDGRYYNQYGLMNPAGLINDAGPQLANAKLNKVRTRSSDQADSGARGNLLQLRG